MAVSVLRRLLSQLRLSPRSRFQSTNMHGTHLKTGHTSDFTVEKGRHAWLLVARGELLVDGTKLSSGDAIATSRATAIHVEATADTDALLFDLA